MTPELENELHKILQCAKPINLMVYANTVLFLAMLPKDIPEPQLNLLHNGNLWMVWRLSNEWVFKGYVMLNTTDGPNKSVDMVYLKIENPKNPKDPRNLFVFSSYSFEDSIPKEILTAIREIMKK
jgi:hypothetical protein